MILSIYVFGSISEYIIGKMVMLYAPPDSDTSLDRRISLDNLDCMACGRINSAGTSPEAQEVMASTSPEEPLGQSFLRSRELYVFCGHDAVLL